MTAELLDRKERGSSPSGGFHPPAGGSAPSSCTCNKCREMPTDTEKICCRKQPASCTTLMPDFQVLILDDAVLRLAQLYRQDVLVLEADRDINREYRHSAYRQYILWTFGRLGAGVRKTIPSCCVWAIRGINTQINLANM
ncbi:hypothetical protein FSP39_003821 [Pinctada imbricata]|uniref:P2X purinoreceptor 7 intracellular domain-containing protein n=1 Tax=Pinctada imbricata TaxID=66713 RepID=A0AA89CD40_PINIB|nr:hypothetical protein FSP39_003821 [Pinctada imbricata]